MESNKKNKKKKQLDKSVTTYPSALLKEYIPSVDNTEALNSQEGTKSDGKDVSSVIVDAVGATGLGGDFSASKDIKVEAAYTSSDIEALQKISQESLAINKINSSDRLKQFYKLAEFSEDFQRGQTGVFNDFDLAYIVKDFLLICSPLIKSTSDFLKANSNVLENLKYIKVNTFLKNLENTNVSTILFYDSLLSLRYDLRLKYLKDYISTFHSEIVTVLKSKKSIVSYKNKNDVLNKLNNIKLGEYKLSSFFNTSLFIEALYDGVSLDSNSAFEDALYTKFNKIDLNVFKRRYDPRLFQKEGFLPKSIQNKFIKEFDSKNKFDTVANNSSLLVYEFFNNAFSKLPDLLKNLKIDFLSKSKDFESLIEELDSLSEEFENKFKLSKLKTDIILYVDNAKSQLVNLNIDTDSADYGVFQQLQNNLIAVSSEVNALSRKPLFDASLSVTEYYSKLKRIAEQVLYLKGNVNEDENLATFVTSLNEDTFGKLIKDIDLKAKSYKDLVESFKSYKVLQEFTKDEVVSTRIGDKSVKLSLDGKTDYYKNLFESQIINPDCVDSMFTDLSKRYNWESSIYEANEIILKRIMQSFKKQVEKQDVALKNIIHKGIAFEYDEAQSDLMSNMIFGILPTESAEYFLSEEDLPKGIGPEDLEEHRNNPDFLLSPIEPNKLDYVNILNSCLLKSHLNQENIMFKESRNVSPKRSYSAIQNFFRSIVKEDGSLNSGSIGNLNLRANYIVNFLHKLKSYIKYKEETFKDSRGKGFNKNVLLSTDSNIFWHRSDRISDSHDELIGQRLSKDPEANTIIDKFWESLDNTIKDIRKSLVKSIYSTVKAEVSLYERMVKTEIKNFKELLVDIKNLKSITNKPNQTSEEIESVNKLKDVNIDKIELEIKEGIQENLEFLKLLNSSNPESYNFIEKRSSTLALFDSYIYGLTQKGTLEDILVRDSNGDIKDVKIFPNRTPEGYSKGGVQEYPTDPILKSAQDFESFVDVLGTSDTRYRKRNLDVGYNLFKKWLATNSNKIIIFSSLRARNISNLLNSKEANLSPEKIGQLFRNKNYFETYIGKGRDFLSVDSRRKNKIRTLERLREDLDVIVDNEKDIREIDNFIKKDIDFLISESPKIANMKNRFINPLMSLFRNGLESNIAIDQEDINYILNQGNANYTLENTRAKNIQDAEKFSQEVSKSLLSYFDNSEEIVTLLDKKKEEFLRRGDLNPQKRVDVNDPVFEYLMSQKFASLSEIDKSDFLNNFENTEQEFIKISNEINIIEDNLKDENLEKSVEEFSILDTLNSKFKKNNWYNDFNAYFKEVTGKSLHSVRSNPFSDEYNLNDTIILNEDSPLLSYEFVSLGDEMFLTKVGDNNYKYVDKKGLISSISDKKTFEASSPILAIKELKESLLSNKTDSDNDAYLENKKINIENSLISQKGEINKLRNLKSHFEKLIIKNQNSVNMFAQRIEYLKKSNIPNLKKFLEDQLKDSALNFDSVNKYIKVLEKQIKSLTNTTSRDEKFIKNSVKSLELDLNKKKDEIVSLQANILNLSERLKVLDTEQVRDFPATESALKILNSRMQVILDAIANFENNVLDLNNKISRKLETYNAQYDILLEVKYLLKNNKSVSPDKYRIYFNKLIEDLISGDVVLDDIKSNYGALRVLLETHTAYLKSRATLGANLYQFKPVYNAILEEQVERDGENI